VFAELLNFFAEHGEALRTAAARMVEQWLVAPWVAVVPAVRDSFLSSLLRYTQRADKGFSLTDCHSMLVMEERGIREALTHDEHFEQAGFRALLRDAK
jgi:predicted nucleic acid-binding protein